MGVPPPLPPGPSLALTFGYMLAAVQEMISIMQDYGEVVCCVGSSFNSANPAIFIQADMG